MPLTPDRALILASAALAVAAPMVLLRGGEPAAVVPIAVSVPQPATLRARSVEVAKLYRPLFGSSAQDRTMALASAVDEVEQGTRPELIGIVGRLPHDAVALVRAEDGRSRTMKAGQSFRGWRLASLGSDAALFVRGTERVRVGLDPAG